VGICRVSSLGGTTSASDTVLGQLFQAVTWAFALMLMAPYTRRILDACLNMKAMICLPILAIASAVWSQDPLGSLRRGVFLLLGTFFAVYLMRRFTVENLAQIVVVTGVIAGTLGILVSVALPQYGRDTFNGDAWQGIFRSKNGCAQIMLFFLSAAICFRFRTRFMEMLRRSLYPISALLIVMSRAKTAWLLAPGLLLLAAFLARLSRFERRNAMLLLTAFLVLLVASSAAMPYLMPIVLGVLDKDPEMSGRLPLWLASIASAVKQPWLGYGYAAFWAGMHGESLNVFLSTHFEIYQAQNGLLEMWLELGLVGVALVSLTLVQAAKNAVTCLQHGFSAATNWYICIFVLTIVYNVDETFLGSAHSLPWLLFLAAFVGLADRARELRSLPSMIQQPIAMPFDSLHQRPSLNQPQPA
jgi:exopolysaccharide production protein ExoQ